MGVGVYQNRVSYYNSFGRCRAMFSHPFLPGETIFVLSCLLPWKLFQKKFSYRYLKSGIEELHGPSMFAVKAKIYRELYKQSSSIAFDETSTNWLAPKNS